MDPPRELSAPGRDALADATVLVVDDHAANVALLELLLRHAGVGAVHGVTDSREVVSCCLELRPDLVLLDLHMPHMDGCAVWHALQAALPAEVFLPVLVLTADDERRSTQARARRRGEGLPDQADRSRRDGPAGPQPARDGGAVPRGAEHNAQLRAELDERDATRRAASSESAARAGRRSSGSCATGRSRWCSSRSSTSAAARLVGVEALARFDCEPRRPPSEWFAEAAEVGLGVELELAAVRAALRHIGRVPAACLPVGERVRRSRAWRADLRGAARRRARRRGSCSS